MKTFFFIVAFCAAFFSQSLLWELKQSGSSLGNPIITDPFNPRIVYYGSNSQVYKSTNRGESFSALGTAIPNAVKIKNLIISRKDNKIMLVAIRGSNGDQILKSTDGGLTWAVTATALTFSYFGIPMTPDPSHQDTIYTMSANNFMKSTDFGSTWATISTPSTFNAPCDIEVFHDSSNIVLAGDNTTGIFRSTDYGVTWQQKFQTSGEIPTIAINKGVPGLCFATRWGSGGGLLKSTDYGETWEALTFFNGKNMWGVDIAPDNPRMVLAGMYSGGTIYVSYDGGETWRGSAIGGSNYAIYIVDMRTIFAAQSTGFYKLRDIYGARPLTKSLTGKAVKGGSLIEWQFETNADVKAYELEASDRKGDFSVVSDEAITETNGTHSCFVPSTAQGTRHFRLRLIDGDGNETFSESVSVEPLKAAAMQAAAYPNPFNPSTTITYVLPSEGRVRITLYNSLGSKVREMQDARDAAGKYSARVDMSGFASGVYYYTVRFNGADGSAAAFSDKLLLQK